LILDFGQDVYIDSVKLFWESSYSKDYKIEREVSTNSWASMAFYQGDDANGGEVLAVGLDSVTSKIQILSYESKGQYGISLYEVSVFGDTDAACEPCPQNRDYCKFDQLTIASISVSSNAAEGANIIDGDPNTRWVSDSDAQELYLDFDEEVYVDSILFQWDVDYSQIYKIYTWNEDFGGYWDLYNVEQVTNAGGHVRFSGVDRVTSRLYVLSLFQDPRAPISLWEIQVFGDPDQDCTPVKTIFGPA
jgi:chondroitin AC lyase